jgi:hypothetical protein
MYRVLNSESCVVSTRATRSRVLLLSSILFYFRNFDVAEWLVEIFRHYRVCFDTQVEKSFRREDISVSRHPFKFFHHNYCQIVVDTAEGFVKCCDSL